MTAPSTWGPPDDSIPTGTLLPPEIAQDLPEHLVLQPEPDEWSAAFAWLREDEMRWLGPWAPPTDEEEAEWVERVTGFGEDA